MNYKNFETNLEMRRNHNYLKKICKQPMGNWKENSEWLTSLPKNNLIFWKISLSKFYKRHAKRGEKIMLSTNTQPKHKSSGENLPSL